MCVFALILMIESKTKTKTILRLGENEKSFQRAAGNIVFYMLPV